VRPALSRRRYSADSTGTAHDDKSLVRQIQTALFNHTVSGGDRPGPFGPRAAGLAAPRWQRRNAPRPSW